MNKKKCALCTLLALSDLVSVVGKSRLEMRYDVFLLSFWENIVGKVFAATIRVDERVFISVGK